MAPEGGPETWRELWSGVEDDPVRRRNLLSILAALVVAGAAVLAVVAALAGAVAGVAV